MPRQRPLTDAERALWEAVARTAAPLSPAKAVRPEKSKRVAVADASLPPADPPARRRTGAAPEPLDRKTVTRIARGTLGLDGRLDLHGLTQDEAHRILQLFLTEAQANGGRMVLVITGKGGGGPDDRGVLRRSVPHWLSSPRFRGLVSGFDQAHRSHGGSGALYVRVKRARTGS